MPNNDVDAATMNDNLTFWIRNELADIAPAGEAVSRWLEERDLPPGAGFLALLTIEELATNCIKYGYDDGLVHQIGIEVRIAGGTLEMSVLDDGHAFNPLEAPPPDLDQPLEDRRVGGLGIYLLRQMSDRLEYERRDGWNRVTVLKSFGDRPVEVK
jgi:anti-sigma regulatory factor (Ser/Thr protein kinase)